jgi:hypothetical protein
MSIVEGHFEEFKSCIALQDSETSGKHGIVFPEKVLTNIDIPQACQNRCKFQKYKDGITPLRKCFLTRNSDARKGP